MSWPTSGVKAVPVSCGTRSTMVLATTASTTASAGGAGAGAAAGAAAWLVSCAARDTTAAASSATRYVIAFMSFSGWFDGRLYGAAPPVFQPRSEGRGEHAAGRRAGGLKLQLVFKLAPVALGREDRADQCGAGRLPRLEGEPG